MLDLLVKYAAENNLVVEPGFAPKSVRFVLQFDAAGRYLGPLSYERHLEFARAPEMSFSDLKALKGSGAHFLVETAQVVTLHSAATSTDDEIEKVRGKHDFFISMLRDAASVIPELQEVADALDDDPTLCSIRDSLAALRAKPTDKLTFMINGNFPVNSDAWYSWWRSYRRNIRGDGGVSVGRAMVCFATGECVVPAATHPKISGLSDVGGMGVGSPLIGFDKDAFLSYGLEQSTNAAVGDLAASAYRAALNDLIERHSVRLATAKVVYWYRGGATDASDPLADLFSGEEQAAVDAAGAEIAAGGLVRSFATGEGSSIGERLYYAMTVSGSAGRVMVRDWETGQFDSLRSCIDSWFGDLGIVHREGGRLAPRPKFLAVLGGLVRELGDIPAPHVTQLWRVAIRGLPFPAQFMAAALHRAKTEIIANTGFNHARMGLLRAYHVRKGDDKLEPILSPEHPSAAYQCGRLMAILASLQRSALGDVGAGVVQRFYAAASTTPALVLARLLRTSQFHLGKIQQPALASWYEGRIAEVMGRIDHQIPLTLTLEQQSLFALGYYQQIAFDRVKKAPAAVAASPVENEEETGNE